MIVNNSLWDDGTYGSSGLGEFQIQYHATNNTVENNIFDDYTLSTKYLVYDFTTSVPESCTMLDYNDYYDTAGRRQPVRLASQDRQRIRGVPDRIRAGSALANSPTRSTSTSRPRRTTSTWRRDRLRLNAGTNLGVNVVGVLDYAGNPRVNGSGQINIGAYEQ